MTNKPGVSGLNQSLSSAPRASGGSHRERFALYLPALLAFAALALTMDAPMGETIFYAAIGAFVVPTILYLGYAVALLAVSGVTRQPWERHMHGHGAIAAILLATALLALGWHNRTAKVAEILECLEEQHDQDRYSHKEIISRVEGCGYHWSREDEVRDLEL